MDVKQVQAGGIISKIIYARVEASDKKFTGSHPFSILSVRCTDLEDGTTFWLEGEELIGTCMSADTYLNEVNASLTEVVEKLMKAETKPFSVGFVKKNGVERVLRGRMITPDGALGRSTVIDFDVVGGSPLRQVDHRTIKWLVMGNTKYIVKSGGSNGKKQSSNQGVVPSTSPEGSGNTGVGGEGQPSRYDGRHQLRGQL